MQLSKTVVALWLAGWLQVGRWLDKLARARTHTWSWRAGWAAWRPNGPPLGRQLYFANICCTTGRCGGRSTKEELGTTRLKWGFGVKTIGCQLFCSTYTTVRRYLVRSFTHTATTSVHRLRRLPRYVPPLRRGESQRTDDATKVNKKQSYVPTSHFPRPPLC